MAGVLELPQLVQHDRPAERHVGGGGIEAELHAQGSSERELLLEPALGNDLGGPVLQQGEGVGSHGDRMLPVRSGATGRLAHVRKSPGLALVSFVVLATIASACGGAPRLSDYRKRALPLAQTSFLYASDGSLITELHAGVDRVVLSRNADAADDPRRGGRDRGQALLLPPRRRPPRDHPRRVRRRRGRNDRRRWVHDHAAAREAALRGRRRDVPAQDRRGAAGLAARGSAHEGPDPHEVPEHGVLRAGRVRHPGGRALVLRDRREGPDAVAVRAARRSDPRAERLRSVRPPGPRSRAAQQRPASDARAVDDHRAPSGTRPSPSRSSSTRSRPGIATPSRTSSTTSSNGSCRTPRSARRGRTATSCCSPAGCGSRPRSIPTCSWPPRAPSVRCSPIRAIRPAR